MNILRNASAYRKHAYLLAAAALSIVTAGCRESAFPVWSSFRHVGSDGWDHLQTLEFTPGADSLRTRRPVDIAVVVRHDRTLPYSSIWIAVEQSDSTGVLRCDTVPLSLADSHGEWKGHRSKALIEAANTILHGVTLTSGYTISLSPALTETTIPGIRNVGIIIIDPLAPKAPVHEEGLFSPTTSF